MQCTILSEDQEKVPFEIQQTDSNTFSIKITSKSTKRRQSDKSLCIAKRQRLNEPVSILEHQKLEPAKSIATKKKAKSTVKLQRLNEPVSISERQKFEAAKSINAIATTKEAKSTAIVRVTHPKAVQCKQTEVGMIVLCKMRGFCPWPALVTEIDRNTIFVEFFGDHTTQKTTIGNLFSFHDSSDFIISNIKRLKIPLYKKAVRQAEISLGISEENSIFVNII